MVRVLRNQGEPSSSIDGLSRGTTMSNFRPGDVVSTLYGCGVIVRRDDNNEENSTPTQYVVRLWRIPGKSMASSAVAYLHPTAILHQLPAAPGMIATLKTSSDSSEVTKSVLVHTYSADRKIFLVSSVPDDDEIKDVFKFNDDVPNGITSNGNRDTPSSSTSPSAAAFGRRRSSAVLLRHHQQQQQQTKLIEVTMDQLRTTTSPSAKFYPVMEALLLRGEEAARAATDLLNQDSTRELVDHTGHLLQEKVQQFSHQASDQTSSIETKLVKGVESVAPQAEESIRTVLQLIKDQELTVLLESCQKRLQQLLHKDLTETTKQALEMTGIRIADLPVKLDSSSSMPSTFEESMQLSRQMALDSIQNLLREAQMYPSQLEKWGTDVSTQFASAFDSLATAAQSDRSLSAMFESITEKTTEWQQLTGRLMQTRSANLFLQGATRLQARAAAILQGTQLQDAGDIGSVLMKSLTEGDVALAKLKSLELGDAVKSRLVEAIEVRSESLGGLDGMIAGALATVQAQSATSSQSVQQWLSELQLLSSSTTTSAHETLLAVLSSRSQYRDVALLRIEAALMTLEGQFLDTLSPEDMAAIVQGEGGTARLFEPIAKRAMQQIESQLDIAESKVTDATVLEVLKRIRKIMSGELTLASVTDEIVNILNDDKVVAAGETLVQHSEHVLDVIEGASGNQAVADAMKIVEKAGITKDVVLKEFEKLDVNELLDTAGSAVTDERARRKLLSQATDTALDFLLRILPSMPVPPFEGVNEGLVYHISNLSMEGFRVRKEDIQIELAGMRATRRASSIVELPSRSNTNSFDFDSESEHTQGSVDSSLDVEAIHSKVKATELLIIDIRNISAILENAMWSFEQTYMPYLKGQGMANVRLSGGAIRLQFELRKHRKEVEGASKSSKSSNSAPVWEPVLCLHDRTCTISDVELTLQGQGSLNWILNKLASIFKGPLRDYVVRTIVTVLTSRSGWILARLNAVLSPYWDLILRTAQLEMDNLVEADENVVINEKSSSNRNFVELVWRERLPLGMNLLMNDESGLLKVVDFPRGSQARSVCEKRGLEPDVFKGATIIGVNGAEYDDQEELFDALKDPSRPKTVRFELANPEDALRIQRFVEGDPRKKEGDGNLASNEEGRVFKLRDVDFLETGALGIEFGNALDGVGLVVRGFIPGPGGTVLSAQKSGRINLGDLLVKINGELVISSDGSGRSQAIERLEAVGNVRPLRLTFAEPYLFREVIDHHAHRHSLPHLDSDGGPLELVLEEQVVVHGSGAKRVVIKGFVDVSGSAESSGILLGDYLVFVNGMPVGAGCRWLGVSPPPSLAEVRQMMTHEKAYPMGLTFARPRQVGSNRWTSSGGRNARLLSDDEAHTMCVTVDHPSQLGCVLEATRVQDIIVADFTAVPGVFQRSLRKYLRDPKSSPPAVESINGQFVPSYATKDMVRNAIQRSWKSDGKVELCLCDETNKNWIHAIAQIMSSSSSQE